MELEAAFAQIQFVFTLLEPECGFILLYFILFLSPAQWRSVPFVEHLVL